MKDKSKLAIGIVCVLGVLISVFSYNVGKSQSSPLPRPAASYDVDFPAFTVPARTIPRVTIHMPTPQDTYQPAQYDFFEPEADEEEVIVYITRTGEKYHKAGCQYLRKSCIAIGLEEAIAAGYTACSGCKPP